MQSVLPVVYAIITMLLIALTGALLRAKKLFTDPMIKGANLILMMIAQPALMGAIRAFDEGAAAARGEYVILANDDIVFAKGAIIRALIHLERTPTCGAVAFADNRPGPTKWNDTLGYGVQLLKAQRLKAAEALGELLDSKAPAVRLAAARTVLEITASKAPPTEASAKFAAVLALLESTP